MEAVTGLAEGDLTGEFRDLIVLHDGSTLVTHGRRACRGRTCSVHNPSDHALREAPLHWRDDRRLMERLCPHGIGHPDPDHVSFVRLTYGAGHAFTAGVHGCDGCCRGPS